MGKDDWREFLQEAEKMDDLREIRRGTMLGRPVGSVEFARQLERELGFSLKTRPKGRPRRADRP